MVRRTRNSYYDDALHDLMDGAKRSYDEHEAWVRRWGWLETAKNIAAAVIFLGGIIALLVYMITTAVSTGHLGDLAGFFAVVAGSLAFCWAVIRLFSRFY